MTDSMVIWQPGMSLEALEKKTILFAYKYYRSNKTLTAQSLGIAVRTLDNKLAQYEEQGEKEAYMSPKREEILERNQRGLTKTGPGGRSHRVSGDETQYHKSIGEDGAVVHKSGPGGRLSAEQLAELRERKAAANLSAASTQGAAQLQTNPEVPKAIEQNDDGAKAGLSVEPLAETPAQHALPVQPGPEVQGVSPQSAPAHSGQSYSGNLRRGSQGPQQAQIHNGNKRKGNR